MLNYYSSPVQGTWFSSSLGTFSFPDYYPHLFHGNYILIQAICHVVFLVNDQSFYLLFIFLQQLYFV